MRNGSWLLLLAITIAITCAPAWSVDKKNDEKTAKQLQAWETVVDELRRPSNDTVPEERAFRGETLNEAFVVLTGEAINPLVGVTALGMYNYFRTEESLRDSLPVYDQPVVWIPLLIIIALMLLNSTLCEAIPFLKIPLNALGDIVNKAGAVAVLPLVVKMFADTLAEPAGEFATHVACMVMPIAHAAEGGVLSGAPGSIWYAASWLGFALLGCVTYAAVWLTFNVVDVLILICPFPGVDAALKSLRLSVIAVLTGSYWFSPLLALVIALVITLFSLFVAGWSFRLSVFGWVFSTDILFFRKREPGDGPVPVFSNSGMAERHSLPMRTLGRLEKREDGTLLFSYKPWLLLSRRTKVVGEPGNFSIGKGLLSSFLVLDARREKPYMRFPPRYRGHEDALSALFAITKIIDCGVAGSVREWFSSLVEEGNVPEETLKNLDS